MEEDIYLQEGFRKPKPEKPDPYYYVWGETGQDQIKVINFPGPDHYIDMERFAVGKVRARRYRNPKIGEFFKEIDLSEKKSTGKFLRELKRNGSPLPEFETDAALWKNMEKLLLKKPKLLLGSLLRQCEDLLKCLQMQDL